MIQRVDGYTLIVIVTYVHSYIYLGTINTVDCSLLAKPIMIFNEVKIPMGFNVSYINGQGMDAGEGERNFSVSSLLQARQ